MEKPPSKTRNMTKQSKTSDTKSKVNPNKMTPEDLQAALVKKRECEARALKIVERLIENPVPAQWFIYSLKYLSLNHLEDIIEERSIVKQCGYPICNGVIKMSPKQQYAISTKSNKVYDITERKKFCTDKCYKASIFVKEQMLRSPLWLRDKEVIPEFKLLAWEAAGVPGLEIEFGLSKLDIEPSEPIFTSINEFCESSISDELPNTFEEIHQPGSFLEENTVPVTSKPVRPTVKAKNDVLQADHVRINRKLIESKFSELIDEDAHYKLSKHQLKMLAINDKNHVDESKQISVECLRQRLENRRKAMEKLKNDKKTEQTTRQETNNIENKNKIPELKPGKSGMTELEPAKTEVSELEPGKTEMSELETGMAELGLEKTGSAEVEPGKIELVESELRKTEKAELEPGKTGITDFETDKTRMAIGNTKMAELATGTKMAKLEPVKVEIAELEPVKAGKVDLEPHKMGMIEVGSERIGIKTAIPKIESQNPSKKPLPSEIPILPSTQLAINYVETSLTEWFTIDSLIFLYGEEFVKRNLSTQTETVRQVLTSALTTSKSLEQNEEYIKLCKKIDYLELREEQENSKIVNQNLKPLPDYRMLRADNKRLIVKVRSFYHGSMEIPEPDYSESEPDSDDDEGDTPAPVSLCPTVDKHSQNVLRRRILCNCLNKIVPGLLQTFGLSSHDMGTEIRALIGTFRLTAKNIIFKPIHLNLLGLIILKIMAEKNKGLMKLMQESTAVKYSNLLLDIYKLPPGYLELFVINLLKIENIVKIHCQFSN